MANKTGRSTVTGGATRRSAKGVTTLAWRSSFAGTPFAAGACRRAAKRSGSRQPNVVIESRRRFRLREWECGSGVEVERESQISDLRSQRVKTGGRRAAFPDSGWNDRQRRDPCGGTAERGRGEDGHSSRMSREALGTTGRTCAGDGAGSLGRPRRASGPAMVRQRAWRPASLRAFPKRKPARINAMTRG